jgi:hypothetical protein
MVSGRVLFATLLVMALLLYLLTTRKAVSMRKTLALVSVGVKRISMVG